MFQHLLNIKISKVRVFKTSVFIWLCMNIVSLNISLMTFKCLHALIKSKSFLYSKEREIGFNQKIRIIGNCEIDYV